jgi:exosortase A-associated hydrolase 2
MTSEESFFFNHEGAQVFGVLDSPPTESRKGLVFCYPFAEERQESHRVMVNLSRYLAENGSHVLRFDPRGTGDSGGEFGDYDLRNWISDILKAVQVLRTKTGVEKIGLLGLRFGATCAILAANQSSDVDFLVLLNPIVNAKAYFHAFLRGNLAFQMATYKEIRTNREALIAQLLGGGKVNVEGYHLSGDMYTQALKVDPLEELPAQMRPSLIVDIAKEEGKTDPLVAALAEKASIDPRSHYVTVVDEPFWLERRYYVPDSEALKEKVREWIDSRC